MLEDILYWLLMTYCCLCIIHVHFSLLIATLCRTIWWVLLTLWRPLRPFWRARKPADFEASSNLYIHSKKKCPWRLSHRLSISQICIVLWKWRFTSLSLALSLSPSLSLSLSPSLSISLSLFLSLFLSLLLSLFLSLSLSLSPSLSLSVSSYQAKSATWRLNAVARHCLKGVVSILFYGAYLISILRGPP